MKKLLVYVIPVVTAAVGVIVGLFLINRVPAVGKAVTGSKAAASA
ncbi:hypothetical protein [Geminisphaera colitermitum]|nr:hypothetical protein [Geminisphaera colitermitum]